MANIIKTKFSAVTSAPTTLAVGELAYSDASDTLFIGDNTGTPVAIGGAAAFTKLAGIEAGAEVNDVTSVAGRTGAVVITIADLSGLQGELDSKADSTDLANYLPLAGGTMSGFITLHASPTASNHAASKAYVDSMALGLDFKQSVKVCAQLADDTSDLGDILVIDGLTLTVGDRVLLRLQAPSTENGIYVFDGTGLVRAPDADTSAEVTKGLFVFVEGGTDAGKAFVVTSAGTLGTDDVVFTQFGGGAVYDAGTGLDLTGTTFSVIDYANILFNDDTIDGGSF